jgi:ferredoxin--NADP+ reductase
VHTPEELETTDVAAHALEALRHSRIREVFLLGRRGPAQAAFTNPEVKEIGELSDADVVVRPEEVQLDALSQAQLDASGDRLLRRKVEILQGYALRRPEGRHRRLHVRFLVSPVELVAGADGRVGRMRLARNVLVADDKGGIAAKATGEFEELEVGLVFRSVGYRGVPLPGVPFHERWAVVPNEKGRVTDPATHASVTGVYVAGWIKRGPSGVIGTNKPDAVETVTSMLEDASHGIHLQPLQADASAIEPVLRARQSDLISYDDWRRLDALELSNGARCGRPRLKFATVDEMLVALGKR